MSSATLPAPAKKNVEAVVRVEQELLGRRSPVERLADGITRFFGSLPFIGVHVLFLACWIAINSDAVPGARPFDPYPFPFLGVVVGVEFICLTTFVLMNQRLQSRRQEQWAHLTLQVCMLAETEVTKNLQMLRTICKHLRVEQPAGDDEIAELTQATEVTTLAEEIEKSRELAAGDAGETPVAHLAGKKAAQNSSRTENAAGNGG